MLEHRSGILPKQVHVLISNFKILSETIKRFRRDDEYYFFVRIYRYTISTSARIIAVIEDGFWKETAESIVGTLKRTFF